MFVIRTETVPTGAPWPEFQIGIEMTALLICYAKIFNANQSLVANYAQNLI